MISRGSKTWVAAGTIGLAAWLSFGPSLWLSWYSSLLLAFAGAATAAKLADRWGLIRHGWSTVTVLGILSCMSAVIVSWLSSYSPMATTNDFWVLFLFTSVALATNTIDQQMETNREHERQAATLRLHALQAQIEPHFVLNTLGNVQQLVRTNSADADRMLGSLLAYLKCAIPEVRTGRSTVGQEIARARAYLQIMEIRMAKRLTFQLCSPPGCENLPIPPLSVMTLVENAVQHGIDPLPGGGRIDVEVSCDRRRLNVRVRDDGAGFRSVTGVGCGLANLRQRLESLHGSAASLELEHNETAGVTAVLSIPL